VRYIFASSTSRSTSISRSVPNAPFAVIEGNKRAPAWNCFTARPNVCTGHVLLEWSHQHDRTNVPPKGRFFLRRNRRVNSVSLHVTIDCAVPSATGPTIIGSASVGKRSMKMYASAYSNTTLSRPFCNLVHAIIFPITGNVIHILCLGLNDESALIERAARFTAGSSNTCNTMQHSSSTEG
jgi:hypothetical protein